MSPQLLVEEKTDSSGLPKGNVLGTILLLLYITDLPEVITAIMNLFADDAKINKSISTVQYVNEENNPILTKQLHRLTSV